MAKKQAELILLIKEKGTKALKSIPGMLKSIGKATVAAGAALAGYAGAVVAFAKQAEIFDEVQNSFQNLAASQGQDADKMLNKMRELSQGTVSDLKLMQQANQALLLGLPVDRFGDMLTIARSASKATGESMDFMLNSIVTGLGRGSKLMLDNLGIVFKAEDAYNEYAAALGKTAAELTEAERKQAFINKALAVGVENAEKSGNVGVSLVDMYAKLKAQSENVAVVLGKQLGPAFRIVLEEGSKSLNSIEEWVSSTQAINVFRIMTKGLIAVKEGFVALAQTLGTLGGFIAQSLEGIFTLSFEKIRDATSVAQEQLTEDLATTGENIAAGFQRVDQLFAQQQQKAQARRVKELKDIKKQNLEKAKEEEKFTQLKALQESARVKGTKDFLNLTTTLTRSNNKTLATIGKAAALTDIAIRTPVAIASSYTFGAKVGGPALGAVFGGIAAAAMAAQAAQVAGIALADGGIVSARAGGVQATIGEGGRDEAVVPLPDDFDPDEPGGIGGNITIVVNGGLLGDPSSAREFALAVDEQLTELRRNNESNAFDQDII